VIGARAFQVGERQSFAAQIFGYQGLGTAFTPERFLTRRKGCASSERACQGSTSQLDAQFEKREGSRIDPLESVGQPVNLRITVQNGIRGAYAKAPELATPVHGGFLEEYRDRRFIPPWRR
jgi:hypothetical protein